MRLLEQPLPKQPKSISKPARNVVEPLYGLTIQWVNENIKSHKDYVEPMLNGIALSRLVRDVVVAFLTDIQALSLSFSGKDKDYTDFLACNVLARNSITKLFEQSQLLLVDNTHGQCHSLALCLKGIKSVDTILHSIFDDAEQLSSTKRPIHAVLFLSNVTGEMLPITTDAKGNAVLQPRKPIIRNPHTDLTLDQIAEPLDMELCELSRQLLRHIKYLSKCVKT